MTQALDVITTALGLTDYQRQTIDILTSVWNSQKDVVFTDGQGGFTREAALPVPDDMADVV